MKPTKPKYKFSECVREDHGEPIFCAQFNPYVKYNMLASVGSNRITVYKFTDQEESLAPVLCFADPNKSEKFYCCAWAIDYEQQEIVLLAAGDSGIIRIISPSCSQSIKYLSGHGGAINDLKVSPKNQELVLSASKDHSIRLWNIQSEACIAIFGGVEGHRDEVLSCDWHCSGSRIISCGMDHSLKIWNFTPDVLDAVQISKTFNDITTRKSFPTVRKHFPTFSTRDIHRNYVDCVAWYGNFILSKSCENSIVCWRPGKLETSSDLNLPTKYTSDTTCSILENFDVKQCDIWFLRFSIDSHMKHLALGNRVGKTYIIDLDSHDHDSKPAEKVTLTHPKCQSAIRQTCFSNDGATLVCSCEDGTLWRWDLSS